MTSELPKNIAIIRQKLIKFVLIGLGISCGVFVILGRFGWGVSAIIGTGFSFLIYDQLIRTQVMIIQKKEKKIAFPRFLFRLGLYAMPLSAGLAFSKYLNFIILLIFLMAFQMVAICYELILNLQHYKRRQSKW